MSRLVILIFLIQAGHDFNHEVECPPKEDKEKWVWVYRHKSRYNIVRDSLIEAGLYKPETYEQQQERKFKRK